MIVLSDAGWRRFFGARTGVLGTTAYLDGEAFTVVGVLPEWFSGTNVRPSAAGTPSVAQKLPVTGLTGIIWGGPSMRNRIGPPM